MKDKILQRLRYDDLTGKLHWRANNAAAEYPDPRGYTKVKVGHHHMLTHRVVFLMHFGEFPKGCIKHINGNLSDNRIENLLEYDAQGRPKHRAINPAPLKPPKQKKSRAKTISTLVRQRYTHDGQTLRWKIDFGSIKAGTLAGTLADNMHFITVLGERIPAGRVAFFLQHKYWPKRLEHINGDVLDIRIENLREGTVSKPERRRALRKRVTKLVETDEADT